MAKRPRPGRRRSRIRRWSWPVLAVAMLVGAGIRRGLMPHRLLSALGPTSGVQKTQRERPETSVEPSDWKLAPVAAVFLGSLVLLTVSCFVLIAAYPTAFPDADRSVRISPPGRQLLTNPPSELQRVRSREEKQRDTYYWVNKSKGTVHIPISQAMRELAKSGIPGFGKGKQQ